MSDQYNVKHNQMLKEKSLFLQYFKLPNTLSFKPKYSIDAKLIDIEELPETLFNYYLLKNSKIEESELSEVDIKKIEIAKWNCPCKEKLFEALILMSLFKQNNVKSMQNIIDLEGGHCDHISFQNNGKTYYILGNFAIHGEISDIKVVPDIMITKVNKSNMFGTDQIEKIIECMPTKKLDSKLLHESFGKKIDLKVKDYTIITCCKVPNQIIDSANKLRINIVVFPLYDQDFVDGLLNDRIELIDEKLCKVLGVTSSFS